MKGDIKKQYTPIKLSDKLQDKLIGSKRGNSKQSKCSGNEKVITLGIKVLQGAKGLSFAGFDDVNKQGQNTVYGWSDRIDHHCKGNIETSWLMAIELVLAQYGYDKSNRGILSGACGSVQTSKNFWAAAHCDNDFWASTNQINVSMNYSMDDEVVQYFCFPTYGFCVTMKHGDVIIFNLNIYHCLSRKTKYYENIDVYPATMYMKTSQIGRNDNSIPLTAHNLQYLHNNPDVSVFYIIYSNIMKLSCF